MSSRLNPTPASVTFTVPRNNSTFARKGKGAWDRKKEARAFSRSYLTSKRKGSQLVTRVKTTERIVLVIGKLPKGGVARVFRRPDPGYFDVAKLLPVAYVVAILVISMSGLLLYADIVNPVRLNM